MDTTVEAQSCTTHDCGTCDATQVAASGSTVSAIDGTQLCGGPGLGSLC